jgi:hypothetical protein
MKRHPYELVSAGAELTVQCGDEDYIVIKTSIDSESSELLQKEFLNDMITLVI